MPVKKWLRPVVNLLYQPVFQVLPVDYLGENAHWMALYHPKPNYPLHILILPRDATPSLSAVLGDDPDIYADLFQLVNQLIQDFNLDQRGYRLITNGGINQSIPIWHWHLVSEAPLPNGADIEDTHD